MNWHLKVHDALWKVLDDKKDGEVSVEGKRYRVEYVDKPYGLFAKTVIQGTTYLSQNLRKNSINTRRVRKEPGYKISWGIKRGKYVEKLESEGSVHRMTDLQTGREIQEDADA